jgi:hypothetical protein
MPQNLTVEKLKAAIECETFLKLAIDVIQTKAIHTLVKEMVDKYRIPLFLSMGFVAVNRRGSGQSEPILHPDQAYRSTDEELYREFVVKCHQAHIDNGFELTPITLQEQNLYISEGVEPQEPTFGISPELVMEDSLRKLEHLLLSHMKEAIGMPDWRTLQDRQKMLDLLLSGACAHLQLNEGKLTINIRREET